MKRCVLSFACVLLLAACSGGDSAADSACKQDYWDGTYGTCLPEDWVVVDPETLRQRGVPADTVVAFQSEIPVSGQFPTVAVTREPLAQVVTPQAYSDASMRAVTVLPGYAQVDSRDIRIGEDKLRLHIFKAQPAVEEPLRRFYQVSTVADGVGYSITATTPVSVDESIENQVLLILRESIFADPEKQAQEEEEEKEE